MTKRFVLAADTDSVLRMVPSVRVVGIFFKVHSSAKLDGIFIVARNIFSKQLNSTLSADGFFYVR